MTSISWTEIVFGAAGAFVEPAAFMAAGGTAEVALASTVVDSKAVIAKVVCLFI